MELDFIPLQEFGKEAERLSLPQIEEGGFIVPGREFTLHPISGKEESAHGEREQAGEEAGSAAGSWERSSAQAAAAGASAHTVGALSLAAVKEELRDYGPRVSVGRSSSRFAYMLLPVGLFRALPFRAELLLEVPLVSRKELRLGLSPLNPSVPDARAWSRWRNGSKPGSLIRTHHQYPDDAMCVCMPNQWILGRHPLLRYVDFCVVWIAKALHERELGCYPGQQHYGEHVRVQRDRLNEYCGCGSAMRYRDCHRVSDQRMSIYERAGLHARAARGYLAELESQDRPPEVPDFFR